MPGPGKKPTKIKLIAGNPGKRALPEHEAEFACSDLSPPDWLPTEAVERWHPLAAALDANGMLNEANRDLLATYCSLIARFVTELQATGEPNLKITQQMRLIAREFGFTPSSQASVVAPGKVKDESNGKSRFFG